MGKWFHYLDRIGIRNKISIIEEVPLLVVTAPMGYGKSTIVRDYLEKNVHDYFWVALGQNTVNEEWFWNRIAQEIFNVNESLSNLMLQIGIPYSSDWEMSESILLTAIHEFCEKHACYFVIDDYQSCNGDRINRFFTRLAYEDISGCHIILISRNHVNIPSMELQMKGYCAFLNYTDLVMSLAETEEFFRINEVLLDENQLHKVYEYTDGWIAVASLICLDYKKRGEISVYGSVNQLLKESVYMQLNADEKLLLYPFSCFSELSIEELSVVINRTVTTKDMERLWEKTGLIHFNQKNNKFSIHTLLHTIVEEERCGDRKDICRRYADLKKKTGEYITAIESYNQCDDYECIFEILDGDNRFEIIEQIPDLLGEIVRQYKYSKMLFCHPIGLFSYLYSMLLSADKKVLQNAEEIYTYVKIYFESKAEQTERNQELLGELLILNAVIVFNDLEEANRNLEQAWILRKKKPSNIFAKRVYSYGVPNSLYMYHREPGTLLKTVEEEIFYSRQYMRLIYNSDSALNRLILAEYALEVGEVSKACEGVVDALNKAMFHKQICIVISSYMVLLRGLIFLGKKQYFYETIKHCEAFMQEQEHSSPMILAQYDMMIGHVYAVIGQLDKIPLWLRKRQLDNCNLIVRDSRSACIVYGLYLCRKRKWVSLAANAEEMMVSFAGTRHVFAEIYANLFFSIALWYKDEKQRAKKYFMKAYEMAVADKIIAPFIELGKECFPMWNVIKTENSVLLDKEDVCVEMYKGIDAFKNQEYKKAMLTTRETELMELLVQGYRNSEIGKRMSIAQVTVEKNLTSIYRKIGVTNRIGAIRWYTESNRTE